MKTKITLFLILLLIFFSGNNLSAITLLCIANNIAHQKNDFIIPVGCSFIPHLIVSSGGQSPAKLGDTIPYLENNNFSLTNKSNYSIHL